MTTSWRLPALVFVIGVAAVGHPAADDKKDTPTSPKTGVIKLFNGKDLTGLYTWLKKTSATTPTKSSRSRTA